MIDTPRNKKMFAIVGVFCLVWGVGASYVFNVPMNPIFIGINILVNLIYLAPFIISYVRDNGYQWICLFLPIGGSFIGGLISGVANMQEGQDEQFYTIVGILGWGAACVLSLLTRNDKKA